MEKKYYDLISSLIKNHKKYENYSSILEELINHVYEQARTVINTVDDEKVIEVYLNKIITSAFITVPKKMNYSVKERQNYSTEIISQNPRVEIAEDLELPEEEIIEEDTFEDSFTTDAEVTDVLEAEAPMVEGTVIEELVAEEEEEDFEITTSEVDDFDKSLMDKMINGIPHKDLQTNANDTSNNIDENTVELYDTLEEIDTSTEDLLSETLDEADSEISSENEEAIVLDFDSQDEILESNIDDMVVQEENENILEIEDDNENLEIQETILEEDFISTTEKEVEEITETFEDDTLIDIDEDSNENILDIEENLETEILEEDESEIAPLDLETEQINSIEENNNLESLEIQDTNSEIDELFIDENLEDVLSEIEPVELDMDIPAEQKEAENAVSCYAFFKFEHISPKIDSEEILTKINSLAQKYPEKQILELVKFKYNDKLSLAEISNKTNLTIDEIINILNEVIDIIKD